MPVLQRQHFIALLLTLADHCTTVLSTSRNTIYETAAYSKKRLPTFRFGQNVAAF